MIIALWVPEVTSAFSARVIDPIQREVWRGGYSVTIGYIPITAHVKQPLWNCDGVIVFLASSCRDVVLRR